MNLSQTLRSDIKANGGTTLLRAFQTILLGHTFHLLFLIRLGTFSERKGPLGKGFARLIEYLIRILFSSDISCKATFGHSIVIMHGHDIVIGSAVIIGDKVKIFNGVTLGNRYTETTIVDQPRVGENVVLCTGSKILGSITIGNDSVVGANSVVLADVPPEHTAIGIPARNIPRKNQG